MVENRWIEPKIPLYMTTYAPHYANNRLFFTDNFLQMHNSIEWILSTIMNCKHCKTFSVNEMKKKASHSIEIAQSADHLLYSPLKTWLVFHLPTMAQKIPKKNSQEYFLAAKKKRCCHATVIKFYDNCIFHVRKSNIICALSFAFRYFPRKWTFKL